MILRHIHDCDDAGFGDDDDEEDLNQGDIGHHFLVNKAAKSGLGEVTHC